MCFVCYTAIGLKGITKIMSFITKKVSCHHPPN